MGVLPSLDARRFERNMLNYGILELGPAELMLETW